MCTVIESLWFPWVHYNLICSLANSIHVVLISNSIWDCCPRKLQSGPRMRAHGSCGCRDHMPCQRIANQKWCSPQCPSPGFGSLSIKKEFLIFCEKPCISLCRRQDAWLSSHPSGHKISSKIGAGCQPGVAIHGLTPFALLSLPKGWMRIVALPVPAWVSSFLVFRLLRVLPT